MQVVGKHYVLSTHCLVLNVEERFALTVRQSADAARSGLSVKHVSGAVGSVAVRVCTHGASSMQNQSVLVAVVLSTAEHSDSARAAKSHIAQIAYQKANAQLVEHYNLPIGHIHRCALCLKEIPRQHDTRNGS